MNLRPGQLVSFHDENQCEVTGMIERIIDMTGHYILNIRLQDGSLYIAHLDKSYPNPYTRH